MAYKLELTMPEHEETLQETLQDWSKDQHDIYIVSQEGHKIFTKKVLLCFYSQTVRTMLGSLPELISIPGISISASSCSVSNLIELLTTGKAGSNNENVMVDVKEAAKALGISLGSCILESKKTPPSTKVVRLPLKYHNEVKTSPAASRTKNIVSNDPAATQNVVTEVFVNSQSESVISFHKAANETKKQETMEAIQPDEPKLFCGFCTKIFKGKRNLKRHKIRKHNGNQSKERVPSIAIDKVKVEIPENDTLGQFESSLRKLLKTHKNVPLEEKPFKCDECEKTFGNGKILMTHKIVHLDVKPFKCDECNKEFAQAGNMKTHRIRHHNLDITTNISVSGDQSCDDCDENFEDSGDLNSHKVLMHSINIMIESSD